MLHSTEKILIVEDEECLGEGLLFNFEAEGYEVAWQQHGMQAMNYIEKNLEELSVIVLDLTLPGIDGYEILARTRALAERIPVLVLSARSLESDKIRAFELGADDYVTKPFGLSELILRVKGLARRKSWYRQIPRVERVAVGESFFVAEKLLIEKKDGSVVRLSPMEGLLLQTFLENENRMLSRAELLEKVWNQSGSLQTRTVDVFVGKLRKYLEENPAKPQWILSIRGIGYAYITDARTREEFSS